MFKGMHLAAIKQATQQKLTEHLSVIQFDIQDFVLSEIKGHPKSLISFSLPAKDGNVLWLCFQLHGKFTFCNGRTTQPDTLLSFVISDEDESLTLPAEKQWALFIGISGPSRQQLLAELPALRKQYEQPKTNILKAIPLSHIERQLLESLSKKTFGSFSTLYHIGQLILKLYTNYQLQLIRKTTQDNDLPHIQLYHQAVAYIRENYLDQALNREKIAEALHCSWRSLSRAFEGRPISLNATILSFRLYKGRELLRKQSDLSVEQIALMLYFPNAKHFTVQYKKYFHLTPREERKAIKER